MNQRKIVRQTAVGAVAIGAIWVCVKDWQDEHPDRHLFGLPGMFAAASFELAKGLITGSEW